MKKYVVMASMAFLTSCGQMPQSQLKQAWDAQNDPTILSGLNYEKHLAGLKTEAQLSTLPWSDDYWATYHGGISFRWQMGDGSVGYQVLNPSQVGSTNLDNLSPTEKYDIYIGRYDFPLTKSEIARTQIMKTISGSHEFDPNFKIPSWEGLCHGWGPASINFKQPDTVTLAGAKGVNVRFYSSDVKALLTYYQQYSGNRSTKTYFMSQRCNESFSQLDEQLASGSITKEEVDRIKNSSPCADVNAGAFHLVLTNEIGKKDASFVADVTRDAEVWNQAVNGYSSTITNETAQISQGDAPGTVKEVTVKTSMSYTVETVADQSAHRTLNRTKNYEYVLELDSEGRIIGGHWISEERPDFLWRETQPEFRGYFKALETIYHKSIGQ